VILVPLKDGKADEDEFVDQLRALFSTQARIRMHSRGSRSSSSQQRLDPHVGTPRT
jgi:hypothetical protein